jgi:hypothetical protein
MHLVEIAPGHRWHAPCLSAGRRWILVGGNVAGQTNRGTTMGDAAFIIGLILFFTLCALYASALERI